LSSKRQSSPFGAFSCSVGRRVRCNRGIAAFLAPRTREMDTARDKRNATGHMTIQPLARALFHQSDRNQNLLRSVRWSRSAEKGVVARQKTEEPDQTQARVAVTGRQVDQHAKRRGAGAQPAPPWRDPELVIQPTTDGLTILCIVYHTLWEEFLSHESSPASWPLASSAAGQPFVRPTPR
jgi:hypothetical protein